MLIEEQVLLPYDAEMLAQIVIGERSQGGLDHIPHIKMEHQQCDNQDLSSLTVTQSEFDVVNFAGSNLSMADMKVCDFYRCNLIETNFCMMMAPSSIFRRCIGEKANFSSCDLYGVLFENCFMPEVIFSSTTLIDGVFKETNLQDALFDSASMERCNLSRAKLMGSKFRLTNARGVNFFGADLSRAELYTTDLTDADLRGVTLTGTVIDDVLLKGTQFTSVEQLSSADLSQQRLSILKCCQQKPKEMMKLSQDILDRRYNGNWLDHYISTDAPAEWNTLFRWVSNYNQSITLTDNPPIELLVQWIKEFTCSPLSSE